MNKGDNQVRAAHKILGYDPIHKSFSTSKYVIRAKDPQLHGITVANTFSCFLKDLLLEEVLRWQALLPPIKLLRLRK